MPEGLGLQSKSLFTSSLQPMQIKMNNREVWSIKNPRSPKLIRPISLIFEKENTELTKSTVASWSVEDIDTIIGGSRCSIKTKPIKTGLDGKCCAAVVGTGCMNCPTCGLTPTEHDKISPDKSWKLWEEKNKNDEKYKENLGYGISQMHSSMINALSFVLKGLIYICIPIGPKAAYIPHHFFSHPTIF